MQAPIGPQAYLCNASSSNNTIQNKTTPNTTTKCIQGFMDLNLGRQSIDVTCITTNAKPINWGDSNLQHPHHEKKKEDP